MATNTCNQNCGCNNTYTVTPPCPPACPEVFNSQCIVYTGTDIICNNTTVISRYDYLDTIITKLVNYICNVEAPVTQVVGSTYIDVVPNTVANVTTYTVYVDVPALQAYFDLIIAQTVASSVLAGPGIDVAVNPVTNTVTVIHEDTSTVASPLVSDNSGNTFIQDIAFTFDTFGHVTGASVVPGTVIPPDDFGKATVNPDTGFTWGPDNDPTNIQIAEAPGDTLNFVAGTGIVLNASTVASTDAIRITNSAPDQVVTLTEGTGIDVTGTYPNFTVANTDPGSAQNIFKNVAVSGWPTVVADNNNDTLTLVAGTNITLSTNAATDSITISNTAPPEYKYVHETTSVFDDGLITITRQALEYCNLLPTACSIDPGFVDKVCDLHVSVYYLFGGNWKKIPEKLSGGPGDGYILNINAATGDLAITMNLAPISPAVPVRVVVLA
jgi:hypothetical protein